MSDTCSIEIVLDSECYSAVEREATRLGLEVPQLVQRATCAWLAEAADAASLSGAREPAVAR